MEDVRTIEQNQTFLMILNGLPLLNDELFASSGNHLQPDKDLIFSFDINLHIVYITMAIVEI